MDRLLAVMRRLRAPDGCPWDRVQTHASLRPYLLEEAYEAVEAIGRGDPEEMAEELGDVLLQVAFHSVIAEEEGLFAYQDVERKVVEKLIHRHPHVFGDAVAETPEEVKSRWDELKQKEGKEVDPCYSPLPALMKAYKVWRKRGLKVETEDLQKALREGELAQALFLLIGRFAERGENPEIALLEYLKTACE
ncbi:MAG: MazG family protein [Thermaceae bacterium]